MPRALLVTMVAPTLPTSLTADVLVLRNGTRVQGGPAGERDSPRNPGRPIPDRPGTALIGSVGESSDPFFIGEMRGGIRMRSTGRLFLGINDEVLSDNSGAFRVVVYH